MEKPKKSSTPTIKRTRKIKAKLLSSYYGNVSKDLKLICITGTAGNTTVARLVHQILVTAGEHAAVLASSQPFKTATLHKFLSDAWKAGATYAVVTAPAESLEKDVFYGLPITVAALTNFLDASLATPTAEDFIKNSTTLFHMNPKIVVLNRDDANYEDFSTFKGTEATFTYGSDHLSDLKIEASKLYKKGTETILTLNNKHFTVASFLAGEPNIAFMACASAIATTLGLTPATITEGIADYDPEA